ncbi:hypothetical protein TTHERM_000944097 (macronuclear) [Tetrahymena thermophila SB210]|uniref:Uncharacterized protein n=1 Tax=Tetrahymena thermophila (strain SB210) TaxID=312017 RepID=W7XEX6_TETTS|nr:hypothetical protein TTHERM_000944097 [Tetrahymena thermophila SB210]EWS71299.1 hypothetical protein TTHERM_000944097 [Tetrahymena thermophila SB210]|eukprot:XP_012656163.1 hypothetical protein TTHERM_000944097 [Tetrahymena thermophila SB210]
MKNFIYKTKTAMIQFVIFNAKLVSINLANACCANKGEKIHLNAVAQLIITQIQMEIAFLANKINTLIHKHSLVKIVIKSVVNAKNLKIFVLSANQTCIFKIINAYVQREVVLITKDNILAYKI